MSKDEEPHNPKYVTSNQCREIHGLCSAQFKGDLQKIHKAIAGDDMRGGMVKDLADLKSKLGIVKTVLLPITLSVVCALLVALVTNGFKIG